MGLELLRQGIPKYMPVKGWKKRLKQPAQDPERDIAHNWALNHDVDWWRTVRLLISTATSIYTIIVTAKTN